MQRAKEFRRARPGLRSATLPRGPTLSWGRARGRGGGGAPAVRARARPRRAGRGGTRAPRAGAALSKANMGEEAWRGGRGWGRAHAPRGCALRFGAGFGASGAAAVPHAIKSQAPRGQAPLRSPRGGWGAWRGRAGERRQGAGRDDVTWGVRPNGTKRHSAQRRPSAGAARRRTMGGPRARPVGAQPAPPAPPRARARGALNSAPPGGAARRRHSGDASPGHVTR
jgi:hypothetical protein